ncbi:hypothetical protein [Blastopirellula marina]|uniref:Uncharacterized protein n=1 Tax=Blastopirellula marina DSM 3645 TaxID=314230 RepID=A3ZT89_9BACT|nr:hypothetical protein [Blastopirellula marina]EAQ80140.1 hypothetical protein DSM3645_19128 [Blastopirellula marina DSM 3645]
MNRHTNNLRSIRVNLAVELWRDERGVASAYGLILIATVLILGAIVGLTSLRDHVVQEYGDLGVAIDSLDQSFAYEITVTPPIGPSQVVVSAAYVDEDELVWADEDGEAPAGLSFGPNYAGGAGEDAPIP